MHRLKTSYLILPALWAVFIGRATRARLLAAVVLLAATSACVTVQSPLALPVGVALRLAEVDGTPAVSQSFTLQLRNDNSYAATYNCGDHFGTYIYEERLTLRPGASTGETCDQVEISTGKPIVYDPSLANDFFRDPNFRVMSRGRFLELRNSSHTFTFVVSR